MVLKTAWKGLIIDIFLGKFLPTPLQSWAADINDDGEINSGDVAKALIKFRKDAKIQIISPNGGENWPVAIPQTIVWDPSIVSSNVKIELSLDAGGSWSTIDTSVVNTGSYSWTPMLADVSDSCLIKVTPIAEMSRSIFDQSDEVFSITGIPILPLVPSPKLAGTEFGVEIQVGSNFLPVSNLFGVSFVLSFTQTTYLDVVPPYSSNVLPGGFMGSDPVFYQTVDEPNGKVSVGISRKSGQGGVSGFGSVLCVKFLAQPNTPNGTQVTFSLSSLVANDSAAQTIPLNPEVQTVTLNSGVIVWPGDTNNNGTVDQADVLPIGQFWNHTGPARANASNAWVGQLATPWSPAPATYADANGDSVVNQADILPIGVNWGKTHTNLLAEAPSKKLNRSQRISLTRENGSLRLAHTEEFWLDVTAVDATDLFGLAIAAKAGSSYKLRIAAAEPGAAFGDDVVFFSKIDRTEGVAAVSISRKSPALGFKGTGTILRLRVEVAEQVLAEENIEIEITEAMAIDGNGEAMPVDLTSANPELFVSDQAGKKGKITEYRLYANYPNPFNPETLIRYDLPQSGHVELKIFNVVGQQVRELVGEIKEAGAYNILWDGRDDSGRIVPSGIYFYRLSAGTFSSIRKMTVLR